MIFKGILTPPPRNVGQRNKVNPTVRKQRIVESRSNASNLHILLTDVTRLRIMGGDNRVIPILKLNFAPFWGFLLICLCCVGLVHAADEQSKAIIAQPEKMKTLYYEDLYGSRTGIQQFYDILIQLQRAMGDLPPDIERLAMYNLRVDHNEFPPGMTKFFQGKIEETFIKYGRRQIIAAPELRQTRVISTDTSFILSNTLPSQEDLWRIGEKLRVDAFIEGNLTRSEVGDVMLNLKVFRHKTAEIIWSGSFVSGPNEQKLSFPLMEMGVRLTFGYMPIQQYSSPSTTLTGSALKLAVYHYGAELTLGEAANSTRRLFLTASGGFSMLTPVAENPRDSIVGGLSSFYSATVGADLNYVFVQKENIDDGYWLSGYAGARAFLPQKLMVMRVGYTSRVTKHFAISGGVMIYPLLDQLVSSKSLLGGEDFELKLENPTYEISIQYAL